VLAGPTSGPGAAPSPRALVSNGYPIWLPYDTSVHGCLPHYRYKPHHYAASVHARVQRDVRFSRSDIGPSAASFARALLLTDFTAFKLRDECNCRVSFDNYEPQRRHRTSHFRVSELYVPRGPTSGPSAAPSPRAIISADINTALLTPGPIGSDHTKCSGTRRRQRHWRNYG